MTVGSMKRQIGVFGLVMVFLVLFALTSQTIGFWPAAFIWALAAVTTAFIVFFVWLIFE